MMKKTIKTLLMIATISMMAVAMAGCGKKESGNETLAPGDYQVKDEGGDALLHVPDPDAAADVDEPIGDVDVNTSGKKMTMKEYTVGADGDMVVTASEKVGIPIEDILPGLTVLFPDDTFYTGLNEAESTKTRTVFDATNGVYSYRISFRIAPNKMNPTEENAGGVYYEETDKYAIDIDHCAEVLSDDGKRIASGFADARVYCAAVNANVEVCVECWYNDGVLTDDGNWIDYKEYSEWRDANIARVQELFDKLK